MPDGDVRLPKNPRKAHRLRGATRTAHRKSCITRSNEAFVSGARCHREAALNPPVLDARGRSSPGVGRLRASSVVRAGEVHSVDLVHTPPPEAVPRANRDLHLATDGARLEPPARQPSPRTI